MDNLLTLAFEAHNAEDNHHRRYEVSLGRDLFDDWTVAIRYGRVGQGGQERRYGSPDPEALRAILRDRLRRRLSAPKRIGCAYRLTTFSEAPGFDASGWLPVEILNAFTPSPESASHRGEDETRTHQAFSILGPRPPRPRNNDPCSP